jgi:hypothetical protein
MLGNELLDFLGQVAEQVLCLVQRRYQMTFLGRQSGTKMTAGQQFSGSCPMPMTSKMKDKTLFAADDML